MEPIWLRLLRSVKSSKTGFTIPYLVGASLLQRGGAPTEGECYSDFIEALVSMRECSVKGKFVRIAPCDVHGEPIASLRPSAEPRGARAVPADSGAENLFVTSDYFPRSAKTIEAVSERLWARHKAAILAGRYSYDREYRAFTASELEDIAAALNGGQG